MLLLLLLLLCTGLHRLLLLLLPTQALLYALELQDGVRCSGEQSANASCQ
jgi:hypothetical protein